MNAEEFKLAIDTIAENKGISHQAVINALRDALETAYVRHLKGGNVLPPPTVKVTIDEEEGFVTIAQIKDIVKEVKDDFLEITEEDANELADTMIEDIKDDIANLPRKSASKKNDLKHLVSLIEKEKKAIKVGGTFAVYCSFEDLSKLTTSTFRVALRQKISEAGHAVLYEVYKDHIGEIITGTVEQVSAATVTVNIGKGTTDLYKEDLIGEEDFKPGDPIKVYIEEVKQPRDDKGNSSKGPQIKATRSSDGFLKRLFEEEIHEIYDGTVLIKGIARKAGIRSKVAVSSTNEDVDPIGACIGPGGSRIQKIVMQLGNAKFKEKIDIIPYSDFVPLYLAESLRPVEVLGVKILDAESLPYPTAAVVIEDDNYATAIGKRGSNATLANKLTGWNIRIYKKSEAEEEGLDYVPLEAIVKEAEEQNKAKQRAEYAKRSQAEAEARAAAQAAMATPAAPVMPEAPADEEGEEEIVASKPVMDVAPSIESVPEPSFVEEEKQEVEETPIETTNVRTTKTLDELEKELAESKDKKEERPSYRKGGKSKRPHQISETEVARVAPTEAPAVTNTMPIYSQEELAEIEQEENDLQSDSFDEEIDTEDYDDYYDDEH